ncbi:HNH endonuclease signature motif containing protein [Nocardia sp. N2S4-5]|uniref:HNH endonuclease signature motif containing protein n=1 Tax=Nocardia sp. N2S4-5 TaxID=3351565 RepID=UPI0037D3F009
MQTTELPERLAAKIAINESTGCWEWSGCRTASGYGRAWDGKRADWAHRVLYRIARGEIPEGKVLDHLCRVRHCVNPAHLEPVTDRENTVRGVCPEVTRARHRAKKFCKRDHELFGANVYIDRRGHRVCRTCQSGHAAAYRERKRAADA